VYAVAGHDSEVVDAVSRIDLGAWQVWKNSIDTSDPCSRLIRIDAKLAITDDFAEVIDGVSLTRNCAREFAEINNRLVTPLRGGLRRDRTRYTY
jgi:hypothetical protein